MIDILSVKNMRMSDAATIAGGISGKELMMRAGKAVFENVEWKPPVAVVCGTGNNAGDGYVLAKLLHDAGIACSLVLLEEKFSEDGRYYYDICRESGIESLLWDGNNELAKYSTIVDCVFGTGFRGNVHGKAARIIEAINSSGAYVVSVDINSGLNGDSGMAAELVDETADGKNISETGRYACVRSDITVSIGSYKPGHFLNMAKDVMKEKINCDIGIRPVERVFHLLERSDIKPYFSPRPNYSNKGTYGYVALIGGSERYSGAIRLAAMANASMRSGAGVVKVAVPRSLCSAVAQNILESTLFPLSDKEGQVRFVESEINELISNVKTVAFGMGIGVTEETAKILDHLLENFSGKLIIDADGLTLLSRMNIEKICRTKARLILTPHIKEFSRLLNGVKIDDILSTPIEYAERYAANNNVILLLKGPSTIITNGQTTYLTDAGCAGMATAGSGDVLSGILAAVCAYMPGSMKDRSGLEERQQESVDTESEKLTFAVATGAYINGKAGEAAQNKINSVSMTASDTVSCIADIITDLEK